MSRRNNKRNNKNKNTNTSLIVLEKEKVPFNYTIRLEAVLLDICDNISFAIIGSYMTENEHGFRLLDLSDELDKFRVYVEGRVSETIGIREFVGVFFKNKFEYSEVEQFIYDYNKRLSISYDDTKYQLVDVSPFENEIFVYNPKDVAYTFNSLCYKTYPFGTEDDILKYIPLDFEQDYYGNYFIKIGESNVMFTSHFDSACKDQELVRLMSFEKDNHSFITSDGKTILSADDKAGVTIMLYMIEHNIPGLYYFFFGEEKGGIGSGLLSRDFKSNSQLDGIKKCISFDRRDYHSVITHQSLSKCCSDAFAEDLCAELNKFDLSMELDNTGMFTDSANFTDQISECTNISVGYFNEHTGKEYQNITYLKTLCEACICVDWQGLNTYRKVGINRELIDKHYDMLCEFKTLTFFSTVKLKAFEDRIFVQVRVVTSSFIENYEDFNELNKLFNKWNLNPYIYLSDDIDGSMLMNIEVE